ncbi:hypothetical protein [Hydrogenophaga flava]|uniref:hypothetical protein n=1 Tax=Hydrogenophaga flava TaxID=65657 RepID=UPI0008264470|nr:hypothetical protein [Hydrogenophaga flava]
MASVEQTLLYAFLISAFLGAFGQSLRAVAGLKKQSDEAAAEGKSLADVFSGKTLGISIFIGAVAGVTGFLGLKFGSGEADFSKGTTLLGVIAAGYAGTDFIEAFAKKYLPK